MKLFNRSTDDTMPTADDQAPITLPPAPEATADYDYTQTQPSTGSNRHLSLALLAVGSLLAIVVVLAGLIFGGRWAYRHFHHSTTPTAHSQTATSGNNSTGSTPAPAGSNTNNTPVTPPASSAVTPAPATSNSTTTPAPGATTPATTLTNTGPGSTVAVFVIASAAGFGLYELRLSRSKKLT